MAASSIESPVNAASPVQDAVGSRDDVSTSATGDDVPFDTAAWQPGKVHTVHSPKEFKAFVMEHSGVKPVMLMCKAQGCRPCKVFSRTFARHAEANPDIVCLNVIGDETKALRRMMVLLGVKMTPSFFVYRDTEQVHSHSGNSEEKLLEAIDVARGVDGGAASTQPEGAGGDSSNADGS